MVGLSALSAHASSVTNTPIPGNIYEWGPSAVGGGQSYGLVFIAPGSRLDDFSLTVSYVDTSFPFVSQVYAWDGSETTGPALYTSGVDMTTSSLTTYTYTPDITVTVGASYIAFVTNQPGPSGVSLGGSGVGDMEQGTGPATFMYAEGNPSGPGAWSTYPENAAFNADFSAVPEPSTWAMLILGAGMIAYAARHRSQRAASAPTAA